MSIGNRWSSDAEGMQGPAFVSAARPGWVRFSGRIVSLRMLCDVAPGPRRTLRRPTRANRDVRSPMMSHEVPRGLGIRPSADQRS